MRDIVLSVQNRLSHLHGDDRTDAENILWVALRQIDQIQQAKETRRELDALKAEVLAGVQRMATRPEYRDDDLLTSKQVYTEVNCKRTRLWELGEAGLLKPAVSGRNGKKYRYRDVKKFRALDPEKVARIMKHWEATRSLHSVHT